MIPRDGKHHSHNATKGLIKFLKVFINTYEEILSFKKLTVVFLMSNLVKSVGKLPKILENKSNLL